MKVTRDVSSLQQPPKPLRTLSDSDNSVEAAAATLLRASEAHVPAPGSKARVRAALLEGRAVARGRWLRPAVIMSLLAGGAAMANASLGRQVLGQTYRRLLSWTTPAGEIESAVQPKRVPAVAPAPQSAPAVDVQAAVAANAVVPTVDSPAPATPQRRQEASRGGRHRTAANKRLPSGVSSRRLATATEAPRVAPIANATPVRTEESATPEKPLAEPSKEPSVAPSSPATVATRTTTDEPRLVASAVRALRRDNRPARAAALLSEYLQRWPNGALAEEALALAIEAAQADKGARGGRARAQSLASSYLRRYPDGRFVETARRALSTP